MAFSPASAPSPVYRGPDRESAVGIKLLALFLGIAVAVMAVIGLVLLSATLGARKDAREAARKATTAATVPGMATPATGARVATPSFAGTAPANADALATAHRAVPAELPAAPAGSVAAVTLSIQHRVVSIAPGIRYEAWTFGDSAPGPVVHVRQSQTVKVTLRNDAPMPHSVDFHAAQIAPNVAFSDVMPGASKTFSFVASTPGVFMYHCGTAPAFVHIANGMYGAIVVEPKGMPPAQKQYVLVASEWYLNKPGNRGAASLDLTKRRT